MTKNEAKHLVFVLQLYMLRKLYFDFVKVIFWLSPKLYFGLQPKLRYLSITCPQGKYHCNAISLSKTISRRRHITAVRRIAFAVRQKHRIIAFKVLLVKAEGDHKSFVDLSHYAAGQIADFVF